MLLEYVMVLVLLMLMVMVFVMMLTTVLDHMTIVVFVMALGQSTNVDVQTFLKETVTVMETFLMSVVFVADLELLMANVTVTETYSMSVAFVAVLELLRVIVTVTEIHLTL
jgi:hypothetical protein